MKKLYPWLLPIYEKIISLYKMKFDNYVLLINTFQGVGENYLIKKIILWFMCENKGVINCNKCHGCRLVISNNHPDIYFLNSYSIGIDDVRCVIEKINHFSQQNGKKIIYINADNLTEFASHALLKILEEPPKNSWFFLITYNKKKLLPTILSRCIKLNLFKPIEKIGYKWLKNQLNEFSKESLLTALRITYQSPLLALELIKNKWAMRSLFFQHFDVSIKKDLFYLIYKINNKNANIYIYWLCSIFMDAIKIHYGITKSIINVDQIKLIQKILKLFSLYKLEIIIKSFFLCYKNLLKCHLVCDRELIILEQLLFLEEIKNKKCH